MGVISEHENVTPLLTETFFFCFIVKGNSRSIRSRDPNRLKSSHIIGLLAPSPYLTGSLRYHDLTSISDTAQSLSSVQADTCACLTGKPCSGPALASPIPLTKELWPRERVHQGPHFMYLRKSNICFCERICYETFLF